jgi:hypothetical protein
LDAMANTPSLTQRVCPVCGAGVTSEQTTCWLCGAALGAAAPLAVDAPPPPAALFEEHRPGSISYSLGTMMLITTMVAVCCGLVVVAPGLGIGVCIVLVPVLVRTSMVVKQREAAGRPVSMGEKIGLAVVSFIVTNVILVVVLVAAVGTFCAVCLGAGSEAAIPFALLIGGGAGIAVIVLLSKWVRSRYRRDIAGGDKR